MERLLSQISCPNDFSPLTTWSSSGTFTSSIKRVIAIAKTASLKKTIRSKSRPPSTSCSVRLLIHALHYGLSYLAPLRHLRGYHLAVAGAWQLHELDAVARGGCGGIVTLANLVRDVVIVGSMHERLRDS